MADAGVRRSTSERIENVLALLTSERDAWLASADPNGTGYLIPLTFFWDGSALIFATPGSSRTVRNLGRAGRTRIGLGPTRDVVMIDGRVELIAIAEDPALAEAFARNTDFDPRLERPEYVMVRVIPETIQAWRTAAELTGREVMRDGIWLAHTVQAQKPASTEAGRDWNAAVITEFRANGGEVAAPYPDPPPMLLLHTVGARSGREHIVPMRCLREGETRYVFASAHGSERNPDWYHNLVAHPEIEIEQGSESVPVRASEVTGEDREAVLARWVARVPLVAEVLRKTDRRIPVMRLERRVAL